MRSTLTAQYPHSSNKIIKKFLQKVLTTCKTYGNMNIVRKQLSKGRVSIMNNKLQEKKVKNVSVSKKQKKNISTKASASMSIPQKPLEYYTLKRGISNW